MLNKVKGMLPDLNISAPLYGGNFVAKGVEMVTPYIDQKIPVKVPGPLPNLSTWTKIALGLLGPDLVEKVTGNLDYIEAAQGMGGHLFADVTVDEVIPTLRNTFFPPTQAATRTQSRAPASNYKAPTRSPPTRNYGAVGVSVKVPVRNGGRYTVR